MQTFATVAAEKCLRMEWVGVHWYGGVSFAEFRQRMEKFHDLYQRPLLVTEFAPADWSAKTVAENKISTAMVLDFMKEALPWLEATPWIAGYTWFSFNKSSPAGTSSALFDEAGALTTCGRYYASITTDRPNGDMRIGTDNDPINDASGGGPWSFIVSMLWLCMW
jgi:Glycosyl hydrolase catalytic core